MGLCAACFLPQCIGHVTVTHTVPEAANHIEDEDGNDEHASSITEWPLNRERNMRCVCVCVCGSCVLGIRACHAYVCAFVHVQSPQS